MRKKRVSKCLVVDTDVARAAGGGGSQNPISLSCRDFMAIMLNMTEHRLVLTRAIQAEWNENQSLASLRWRRAMFAQKRVCLINAHSDEELHHKFEQSASSENKRKAMLKDIHLIEAALETDKIVISMDETARNCFREVTHEIRKLKQIAWVNPCKSEETPLDWLQNGAELKRERLPGYRREDANE